MKKPVALQESTTHITLTNPLRGEIIDVVDVEDAEAERIAAWLEDSRYRSTVFAAAAIRDGEWRK